MVDILERGKNNCLSIKLLHDKLSRHLISMAGKGKWSSEINKAYNGEGDKVAWLKKAELLAKLTDIKDLA